MGEILLTNACLINRMPTEALDRKIHFFILMSHRNLFHLTCTFGCVRIIHNHGNHIGKLNRCAVKLIFWVILQLKSFISVLTHVLKNYVTKNITLLRMFHIFLGIPHRRSVYNRQE